MVQRKFEGVKMIDKKITLITDDKEYICLSLCTNKKNNSADVDEIKRHLEEKGWDVDVCKYNDFNDIDVISDRYIFYASSEDLGLFYKDYIEDRLFALKRQGNILLPELDYFRAHHNKAYMEMLRQTFHSKELKSISSMIFSSPNDLKEYMRGHKIQYPVVAKVVSGSGSAGVAIAKGNKQLMKIAKKFSKRIYFDCYANLYRTKGFQSLKNVFRKLRRQRTIDYRDKKGRFIVQNFVENLSGDYKVLIFGDKFYVLKRDNRDNDFRASGSGKFAFPNTAGEVVPILNYAKLAKSEIDQPMMSLDIAYDGVRCHLIEFQCISFGPYTLQMSDGYFVETDDGWKRKEGKSVLEEEIADAINTYCEEKTCV